MKDGMNHKITFSYIANSEKAQYENSSPQKTNDVNIVLVALEDRTKEDVLREKYHLGYHSLFKPKSVH